MVVVYIVRVFGVRMVFGLNLFMKINLFMIIGRIRGSGGRLEFGVFGCVVVVIFFLRLYI